MNDTLAAKLAQTEFESEAKLAHTIVVFLDAGDWSQVPRIFTHWKYKKDSKYTIIDMYAFKCCWTFLLTFFLHFYVTWKVIWLKNWCNDFVRLYSFELSVV